MKKLVIFLFIIILLFIGMNYYQQKYKTIECWWGVMYPSLSFIGFEDNEEIQYSSLDKIKVKPRNETIKYKSFILEWLKEKFSL